MNAAVSTTGRLTPETLALLDFLCSVHVTGVRVTKLRTTALWFRLYHLWRAGLVTKQTFTPTPWALHDWQLRNQSDSSPPIAQAELEIVPPTPTAAKAGGGAAARKTEAPPPKLKKRRANPSMAERAKRFDAERAGASLGLSKKEARSLPDAVLAELSKAGRAEVAAAANEPRPGMHASAEAAGAAEIPNEPRPLSVCESSKTRPDGCQLADKLEAWCESSGASKIRLGLHLFGSAAGLASLRKSHRPKQSTIDKVEGFLADPWPPEKLPQRSKPVRAPRINPAQRMDGDDPVQSARRAQAFKNNIRKKARAALDAGLTPSQASPNAGVRGAMKELTANDEAQRRAACPIEQAKTKIRRRGFNCFDACVLDGENKGKGHYYIGNRRVTQAELLAEAERMRV